MNTIVELKLSHGFSDIAQISKQFELPNVFGDEGLKSDIKLTDAVTIRETLRPAAIDLESKIVTIQKLWSVDIAELVAKETLNKFVKDLEIQNWSVQVNQDVIDKLNEPPKSKDVIKNEEIVNNKPKLSSALFTFIFIAGIASLVTYFFNNEKFTLTYLGSMLPIFIIGTGIGHYLSIRKYNKAESELKKQINVSSDLSTNITK